MAHGSHSAKKNDRSLELGYQEDDVHVGTLIKFLAGLAVFTALSMGLMYGLKVALEYQIAEEDKVSANPMKAADPMTLSPEQRGESRDLLPPEPRIQAAPGFGVRGADGKWMSLENKAPQAEYWELEKQWNQALAEGEKDAKTGTVIAKPIEAAMKEYLAANPPVREGAKTEDRAVAASDTSAGRVPGASAHAMAGAHEGAAEMKAAEGKTEGAKPAPSPTPAAKAAAAAGGH
jgi:hypothetical protein